MYCNTTKAFTNKDIAAWALLSDPPRVWTRTRLALHEKEPNNLIFNESIPLKVSTHDVGRRKAESKKVQEYSNELAGV
jgi:hypothetical protein